MSLSIAAVIVFALLMLWPKLLARWRASLSARFLTKANADKALSVGCVAAALVVLLHGDVWVAFCLFGLSLWLLGRAAGGSRRRKVLVERSATIELSTNLSDGRRSARIVDGPHRGVALDRLAIESCFAILAGCRASDPAGGRLLEHYLDARMPGWRAVADRHDDAGPRAARASGGMTEQQAYELLGLDRGAPREAVVRAHRTLMKTWHPDGGGTAELAARANEAKEVVLQALLRRHG